MLRYLPQRHKISIGDNVTFLASMNESNLGSLGYSGCIDTILPLLISIRSVKKKLLIIYNLTGAHAPSHSQVDPPLAVAIVM